MVAADRDRDSVSRGSSAAIVITDTTDAADAISVDAADSAAVAEAVAAEEAAAADNSKHSAAIRASAHHSLRSYRMAKPPAGSIRSATAASSADRQTVIWRSRATPMCRRS